MTLDEQEALSHKYYAHGLLALSSGEWALFSPDRKLIKIFDGSEIMRLLDIISEYEIREPERTGTITELNLEELGL